jgi:uncharacterized repeat protein (TIGR01451 family)
MKRRIVRITAGAFIVLAWLAAGVYAFWGNKKEGEALPAVDAQQMSQQIAAANAAAAQANPVTPAVAVEDAGGAAKPAANGLFSPSKLSSTGTFKPRPNAFQPASAPSQPPTSVYGGAAAPEISIPVDDETLKPMPQPDASSDVASADPADGGYKPNPLRGADESAEPMPVEHSAAPSEDAPLAPPPSRFGASGDESPTPAPRPASTFAGGSRFGAPPRSELPTNELPAEPAREVAPPPARGFGGSRFGGNIGGSAEATAPAHSNEAPAVAAAIASARPGQQAFEGTQSPSLVIEKLAPAEIQVGKPARFEIHVRNAGQTAAQQVIVTDHVPAGTKLVETKPQADQGAGGLLVWQLGKLEPGEDKTVTIELLPEQEGEIGSVAQLTFAAAASVKTVCTKPQLVVEHVAPSKVMIGETVTLQITITNPGTGAATNVVLQEDVPEGLAHSAGKELEYEVGTLRPGESRKLELQLEAAKAGQVQNRVVVRGDANLTAEHVAAIEVVAPQLAVEMNGPKRRYLDRQATYTVSIANPGTAAARDVEVVAYLPKGMKFVSTDKEGQYDAQNHAVYWSLEELPAAQQGSAQLVAVPFETGEQKLRVEGHAQQNLTSSDEEVITVEAIPQLVFEIVDEADPIEVGADTIYQIRVTNEGSKAATNVQVAAALPAELRPVSADGATHGGVQGQNVVFEPLAKLAPQAEAIFKIQATGLRAGDYTIRVQVTSDDLQTPVTKEEPTRVYADR